MLKKILYVIVVIVIIVILAIMWTDSKNKKVEAPVVNSENTNTTAQSDTTASINNELDSINVDSGIDTDLKSVDVDVKTL